MKHLLILTLLIFVTYSQAQEEFSKKEFEKVIKTIKQTSLHKLTDSEIYEGAIRGVLQKLEEKNQDVTKNQINTLLIPEKKSFINNELSGEMVGIGAVLKFDKNKGDRYPVVTEVLDGGARDAGVKPGDEIIKVDDYSVAHAQQLNDVIYKIRGKEGSKVKLSIVRNGDLIIKDIKRKKIIFKNVDLTFPRPQLGMLRIKYFNKKTYDETKEALLKMKENHPNSCMVDLRSNAGGALQEGVKTLELFAHKGDMLFRVEKNNGKYETIKATQDGIDINCKWAVLVDGDTGSFAEVFSNALRTLKQATVIGNPTLGKTSVESIMDLDNGYAVKYTIGRIHGPEGQKWGTSGISPDIFINFENGDKSKENHLVNSAINFLVR